MASAFGRIVEALARKGKDQRTWARGLERIRQRRVSGPRPPSRHRTQTGEKSTSAVGATLPLRPGAAAQLQYALV